MCIPSLYCSGGMGTWKEPSSSLTQKDKSSGGGRGQCAGKAFTFLINTDMALLLTPFPCLNVDMTPKAAALFQS